MRKKKMKWKPQSGIVIPSFGANRSLRVLIRRSSAPPESFFELLVREREKDGPPVRAGPRIAAGGEVGEESRGRGRGEAVVHRDRAAAGERSGEDLSPQRRRGSGALGQRRDARAVGGERGVDRGGWEVK